MMTMIEVERMFDAVNPTTKSVIRDSRFEKFIRKNFKYTYENRRYSIDITEADIRKIVRTRTELEPNKYPHKFNSKRFYKSVVTYGILINV